MRVILAVGIALALSGASSAAQTVRPNVNVPQLPPVTVSPAEPESHQLESPPELDTPRMVDEANIRKVALLQSFNMTGATEAWLRPSMWASPRYRSGAHLTGMTGTRVVYNYTSAMPYGEIQQRTDFSSVTVHVPASVRRWLLVECAVDLVPQAYVAGRSQFEIAGSAPVALAQTDSHRLVLLYPPAVYPEFEFRVIPDRHRSWSVDTWSFGGCEITPVEPP